MTHRTCDVDGCSKAHLARGMCRSHYKLWHRETHGRTRQDEYYTRTCQVCDVEYRSSRPTGKFCSDLCKGVYYSDALRKHCKLPSHHPVMARINANREAEREARKAARAQAKRSKYEWRTARECPGCACWFTPLHTPNAIACSTRCSRRISRWRRRSAENNATGSFTWSEFMRVARRFGYCCAYCGERDGQLDPDHVVPLSRGGSNSTTNLLPSCRRCNGDKRDLLLHEWALDREQRGKQPRATNWAPEDRRYWHLTDAVLQARSA